jgi:exopolyphosphatase/guanosine-5'-triphosphate,3'-diphosphate pyrophosphatase
MTRAAAVDIGTNTVLLAIAERRGGLLPPLCERAARHAARRGSRSHAPYLARRACATLACLREYGALIARHDVAQIDAVGTSALRDASADPSFLDEAEHALGTRPRVVNGEEEAELTFHGSLSGLSASGSVLVFDVGGGSTEVVSGSADGAIGHSRSLDVGSVRLFERHVRSDPPSSAELGAVRLAVREALASSLPPAGPFELIGVAGTVTTSLHSRAPGEPLHGARTIEPRSRRRPTAWRATAGAAPGPGQSGSRAGRRSRWRGDRQRSHGLVRRSCAHGLGARRPLGLIERRLAAA